jgi:hypothetical protein
MQDFSCQNQNRETPLQYPMFLGDVFFDNTLSLALVSAKYITYGIFYRLRLHIDALK